jgi:hypothetical protein
MAEMAAWESTTGEMDEVLRPYLHAPDEAAAELALSRLLYEQAEPVIGSILRHKLRVNLREGDPAPENQQALELRGEVRLQLLGQLEEMRARREGDGVVDFRGYVATLAYHACAAHLRHKFPKRYSLGNKLRYLLTNNPEFAVWEETRRELLEGTRRETMAGRAEWRDSGAVADKEAWDSLREYPAIWAQNCFGEAVRALKPLELLREVFSAVKGAVEFDDLIGVCAVILGLHEGNATPVTKDTVAPVETPGQTLSAALQLEQKQQLERLWDEVSQLPLRQRNALLLNLRDSAGRGIVGLLPLTGVASMRRIAEALEMSPEELAETWPQLPLDDAGIALRLGVTRQQVINLRQVARERLARRIKWMDA